MTKPDKRDEIVRAALELIAEHGFHGAPMAMIADRAGVGAGTIYRYFENKDVLINELYLEIEKHIITAHSRRVLAGKTIQGAFPPFRHDAVAVLYSLPDRLSLSGTVSQFSLRCYLSTRHRAGKFGQWL